MNDPTARQTMLRVPAPAPDKRDAGDTGTLAPVKALPQNWAQSEAARIVQQARQEIAGERQAEQEAAEQRSARYATHREVAGAFVTQPFAAVREPGESSAGEQPWYEQGSRTVAVDLAGRPRLHRVSRTAPKPPPAPLGAISSRWVETIPCPAPPVFDPRQYGPYLRAVGAATGTRTHLEAESAWRLAIETGPFVGPLLPCRECRGTGMVWIAGCNCDPAGPDGYGHERYCGAEQCPNGCPFNPEAAAS